jgi:hypothetical protein
MEQRLLRHAIIAIGVIWRDATFVAKSNLHEVPPQVAADPGEHKKTRPSG